MQGKLRRLKGWMHEMHGKYAATADQLERNGLLRSLVRFLTTDPGVMGRHAGIVQELEDLVGACTAIRPPTDFYASRCICRLWIRVCIAP